MNQISGKPSWEQHGLPIAAAVVIFIAFSLWAGIASEGFLEADAITHYLYARFAFQEPHYFTNVWGRPLCTGLYAVPAALFGRIGVRVTALLLALLVAWCALAIARGQKHRWPALAVMFTLAQPLVFLHSFAELTELPFAAVLGAAFLAYQRKQFAVMALLIGISPMGRPEGFGFIGLAGLGLILHRRWRSIPLLIVPLLGWNLAGWLLNGSPAYESSLPHSLHWLLWLKHEWPYAGESLYPSGHILKYIALLPAVVGPFLFPPLLLGIWRSLIPSPSKLGEGRGEGLPNDSAAAVPFATLAPLPNPLPEYREREHWRRREWLIAVIPLLILVGHSILHALGKMASSGELRYLLIVAPFWGLLAARGWEWVAMRVDLKYPLRYAGILALLPCLTHCKMHVGGYTFGYRVLPIALTDDALATKRFVAWYDEWPMKDRYPRVMAAHPAYFYFSDTSPTDQRRSTAWLLRTIKEMPHGTIMMWDEVYGVYNADGRRSINVPDIEMNDWVRWWEMEDHVSRELYIYLSAYDSGGVETPYFMHYGSLWAVKSYVPPPPPPK